MDDNRLELLGQVAVWYYEDNMDQTEIAERIGKSRSMVSRMLNEARDLGLIEVRVKFPLKTDQELETKLCEVFHLTQARVLADPPADYTTLVRRLGRLGSYYLQGLLRDNIKISVGWGATLHQLVKALPTLPLRDALVIQTMGSIGRGDPMIDGAELARWLSQKLSARLHYLPAPLIVGSEEIAQSLLKDPLISNTLSLARQVDIALVGIGPVDSQLSGLYRTGYLTEADAEKFTAAGIVGDLMGRLIDINGYLTDAYINRCIVGQDLASLRQVPIAIGIAGSVMKAPAILGALRTGCLDVMIMDALTATEVLEAQLNLMPASSLTSNPS
ncbi:MAG: sugar-binding transcriptional regulator [Anaerolineales bacterium]|nr:sugar-binding transcriptional regulator [Anaerolineales bacterium]